MTLPPGSVQETDDAVVFQHQRPEEAGKWAAGPYTGPLLVLTWAVLFFETSGAGAPTGTVAPAMWHVLDSLLVGGEGGCEVAMGGRSSSQKCLR